MSNDLVLIENQLRPMMPHFGEALQGTGLAPERLVRTILVSLERTPELLECSRPSIIQSAMTAAVLGLEADGATGQFFMLPFKNKERGIRIAQPVIGYKGYTTIGARNGYAITGNVVREGDGFEFADGGSNAFVKHVRKLGAGGDRRIIAAWACAARPGFTDIVEVMDIDEILFVRSRSPGFKMAGSPWKDMEIGFPAMAAKTAKRRLARSMPLGLMVRAAALDEAFDELGKPAYLDRNRDLVVDGHVQEIAPTQPGPKVTPTSLLTPRKFTIHKAKGQVICDSIEQWRHRMEMIAQTITTGENMRRFLELNAEELDSLYDDYPDAVNAVGRLFEARAREAA